MAKQANPEWWNKYVFVPFVDHGRTMSGADCWGLVRLVYQQEKQIELPDRLNYQSTNDVGTTSSLIQETRNGGQFYELSRDEIRDFDLVVFKVEGWACHIGIVCDGARSFLHVTKGANGSIERLDSLRWGGRIESFWRVRE